ncbi:hypothetical protein JRO89_XS11G0130600 [Xanthoceras sorbifolium]|uniref:Uncharacterized protein n=1 Tax=Xanthoceras sorbifolium TaxID=99658 RepID=A0ABQ8HFJ9_9ROSI|nr:hypothetical protein JRO89_XS11G0130600 [Xanthoceras sorbifolium]
MAVKHGRVDVIRELLLSCPESIEKLTTQKETVFHLAANKCQSDAFEVLLDEAMKLSQQHLLHQRDRQGNTALHIAVSNQLVRVVKLLLTELNSETGGHGFIIQVNAKNKKGETALDLYNQIPNRAPEIGHLLHVAGGREGYLLQQKQSFPNLRKCEERPLGGFLVVLLCSFPCRCLLLLAAVATFIVYALFTYYIVPKFFIRIGSHYMKLVSNVVFPSKKRLARFKRSFWVQMVGITSTTAASNN